MPLPSNGAEITVLKGCAVLALIVLAVIAVAVGLIGVLVGAAF